MISFVCYINYFLSCRMLLSISVVVAIIVFDGINRSDFLCCCIGPGNRPELSRLRRGDGVRLGLKLLEPYVIVALLNFVTSAAAATGRRFSTN